MQDRPGATRSLVLGLLSLMFGILSPFAVWSAVHSLRSGSSWRAGLGLAGGVIGGGFLVTGILYWGLTS